MGQLDSYFNVMGEPIGSVRVIHTLAVLELPGGSPTQPIVVPGTITALRVASPPPLKMGCALNLKNILFQCLTPFTFLLIRALHISTQTLLKHTYRHTYMQRLQPHILGYIGSVPTLVLSI